MIDWPVVFALLAVIFALGIIAWAIRSARRPPPALGPIVIEDAVTELKVAPWSPTRGHYTFRVADLPEAYQALPGIAGTTFVKQFAEDENDARAQLLRHCLRKRVEAGRKMVFGGEVKIDAVPVSFKPLLKRKGQTDAG